MQACRFVAAGMTANSTRMPITILKHQRIRDSQPVLVIVAFALLANLLLLPIRVSTTTTNG
jgi:hypothetical protein